MIADRLRLLIDSLGIEDQEFAQKVGISKATLSNILTKKTKSTKAEIVAEIWRTFPSLNIRWLLLGEGEIWEESPLGQATIQSIEARIRAAEAEAVEAREEATKATERADQVARDKERIIQLLENEVERLKRME